MPETSFDADADEHIEHHRYGRVRARGPLKDGRPHGYWEWYRLDGIRLRSGFFAAGEQVGEWTTHDKAGAPYKVTSMGDGDRSD